MADLTAVPPRAYYLGLDDCVYFDMTDTEKTGGDPQVKFTKDLDEYDEKCFTLERENGKSVRQREERLDDVGNRNGLIHRHRRLR